MKHLIILGDGMADWPVKELGGKTLLQYAETPHLDSLARMGRNGRLKTIPDGFHPGSEVANSSILGYDQHLVYEGRGPLEAASIGVHLDEGDLALRCNLVCMSGDILKNHSCGRLETIDADVLITSLQNALGNERVQFYTGVQYRHLLVIKGGDKRLHCTPPHDIPGCPYEPYLPQAAVPEAEETAQLLRDLIEKSQEILQMHPLNFARQSNRLDKANSIWPWGGGYKPQMTPLTTTFPQIHSGAVITAVDLIRGIGRYAGLRAIEVEGATGLYDTDYEGKAEAALMALQTDDFVYLHVEASDEAGHDGEFVTMRAGSQIATLDMEAESVTEWSVDSAQFGWMGSDMIYAIDDHGELIVYDFDGLNRRIIAYGVTPGSPATITADKWLYYFDNGHLMRKATAN